MIDRSFGKSGYRLISKEDGNWIQLWTTSTSTMINLYELEEVEQFLADFKEEFLSERRHSD